MTIDAISSGLPRRPTGTLDCVVMTSNADIDIDVYARWGKVWVAREKIDHGTKRSDMNENSGNSIMKDLRRREPQGRPSRRCLYDKGEHGSSFPR